MRITPENCITIAVDYQTRLVPAMAHERELIHNSRILLQGLRVLDVPVLVSQQYTKGLGETVPEIRELVAGAVASLKYDNVSVMLVPVRESVTVPDTKLPSPLLSPGAHTPALLLQMLAMAAVLLALGVGGWVYGRRLLARRRAAREALEAGEGDDTGKQGEA